MSQLGLPREQNLMSECGGERWHNSLRMTLLQEAGQRLECRRIEVLQDAGPQPGQSLAERQQLSIECT